MEKFEVWGDDAKVIVEGCANLLPQHETSDDVYSALFTEADNDVMVQELLQLLFKSFCCYCATPPSRPFTWRDVSLCD